MDLVRQTFQSKISQGLGSAFGFVLSILLCFSLFIGQTMPSMAGQTSNAPLGWVEICGDGGSYFIQIGEDDENQAPACVHCDMCLGPSVDVKDALGPWQMIATLLVSTTISYSIDGSIAVDCPEQFWSACRGPPIASTNNTMKTLLSLTTKEPAVTIANKWGFPCV